MTYPYDATGVPSSRSTTTSAARSCSYSRPSRSAPTTTNTHPSPRPMQVLNEPTLETREYDFLAFGGTYSPTTTVSLAQRYTYTGRELNPASALAAPMTNGAFSLPVLLSRTLTSDLLKPNCTRCL